MPPPESHSPCRAGFRKLVLVSFRLQVANPIPFPLYVLRGRAGLISLLCWSVKEALHLADPSAYKDAFRKHSMRQEKLHLFIKSGDARKLT
jgi:hypothetical protein